MTASPSEGLDYEGCLHLLRGVVIQARSDASVTRNREPKKFLLRVQENVYQCGDPGMAVMQAMLHGTQRELFPGGLQ